MTTWQPRYIDGEPCTAENALLRRREPDGRWRIWVETSEGSEERHRREQWERKLQASGFRLEEAPVAPLGVLLPEVEFLAFDFAFCASKTFRDLVLARLRRGEDLGDVEVPQ